MNHLREREKKTFPPSAHLTCRSADVFFFSIQSGFPPDVPFSSSRFSSPPHRDMDGKCKIVVRQGLMIYSPPPLPPSETQTDLLCVRPPPLFISRIKPTFLPPRCIFESVVVRVLSFIQRARNVNVQIQMRERGTTT